MEETPPWDVIFLKKKLLILVILVLIFSCLTGCERAPYWPTPWDVLQVMLPRLSKVTDAELRVELTFTYDGEIWKLG